MKMVEIVEDWEFSRCQSWCRPSLFSNPDSPRPSIKQSEIWVQNQAFPLSKWWKNSRAIVSCVRFTVFRSKTSIAVVREHNYDRGDRSWDLGREFNSTRYSAVQVITTINPSPPTHRTAYLSSRPPLPGFPLIRLCSSDSTGWNALKRSCLFFKLEIARFPTVFLSCKSKGNGCMDLMNT